MPDTNKKLKQIMLVEDDSIDAMTVKKALNELNIKNELIHFTTSEKALEFLKNNGGSSVCVILLDLNLPGINGVEFLEILKANNILKRIPVIIMAASTEEKNIVETFNLGVAGYIFKPIDSKKLGEFEPLKLFLAIDREAEEAEAAKTTRRTHICLLLLAYLILANISYNLWAKQREAPIQDILTADVIYDLWTKKVIATKPGTVVGVVYSEKGPCVLINRRLLYEGDITSGVKIVKIDRDKIQFEKNGQRWTQKLLDNPNPAWETTR